MRKDPKFFLNPVCSSKHIVLHFSDTGFTWFELAKQWSEKWEQNDTCSMILFPTRIRTRDGLLRNYYSESNMRLASGFVYIKGKRMQNVRLQFFFHYFLVLLLLVLPCFNRNWLAGRSIARNITDSIEKSRKTVLILSNAFARSYWCELELTMAQHKLLTSHRFATQINIHDNSIRKKNTRKYFLIPSGPVRTWRQHIDF